MQIMNKISGKVDDNYGQGAVTIAFLGDSVTQGCFEVTERRDGGLNVVFDKESAYHAYLDRIFSILFPNVPINVINAGISGGNALHGLERLERDVLRFQPDLTVVCFGLNDSGGGEKGIDPYCKALEQIFLRLKESGSEVIFMTPNMMNTYVSEELCTKTLCDIAEITAERQNGGIFDAYIDAALKVCEKNDVKVCDCYKQWKRLAANGVDITNLLSNKINHPTRELNWLFAISLIDVILG